MRVLITGSSGLVGSAAVTFFCRMGCDVIGVDNNMRADFFGPKGDTSSTLLSLLAHNPTFRHTNLDIRNRCAVMQLFARGSLDLVIHAAAQPSHDLAASRPFDDFDVNASATLNLLEACRRHAPDAVFTFLSTNKVYGDGPNHLPQIELETRFDFASEQLQRGIAETFAIDQTMHSVFGASKVAADVMVQEYGRYFGLRTGVFRGGCLTGPAHRGVELHGFLNYLVRTAVVGGDYTVYGHQGKQVRDQIHADDVIAALWAFAQKPRTGEVYNIGGGRENAASLLECVDRIEAISGKRPELHFGGKERRGDHRVYYTDLTKLQAHYPDWQMRYTLDDILQEQVGALQPTTKQVVVPAIATAARHEAKTPKVAWVYPAYSQARIDEEESATQRLNALGNDVHAFGIPCEHWYLFPELDDRYRNRDPQLMASYERFENEVGDADILVAAGGSMLHPDFVRQFRGTSVFCSADDPENSAQLSQPIAPHFDLALVINPTCLDDYRAWGCKYVEGTFPGLRPDRIAPGITQESILNGQRELDIALCCERDLGLSDRAQRVEALVRTFPQAHVRGPGWPKGSEPQTAIYPRARLGWNLHNSTGPCNTRFLELPANGVFQLCDNPEQLHRYFVPGKEIVGFSSLEECVELTHYYLQHEDERRTIAAASHARVMRDYTEQRWFEQMLAAVARQQAARATSHVGVAPRPAHSS
ncbi:MAG: CDP-paratose 2-epimerase [Planctomycetota bacterium]|jgi:CDP-paratose 2-epimerase